MRVAITFDVESDFGMDRSWKNVDAGMPLVSKFLKGERIKSTFFVTGRTLEQKAETVLAACRGHELASHGYTHKELWKLTPTQLRAEISKSLKAFAEHGLDPAGFRAPRFCMSGRVLDAVKGRFEYDSSVVPSFYSPRFHPLSPRIPHATDGLVELPIGTTDALRIPATSSWYFLLGGLYLRLARLGVPDTFVFVLHSGDFCRLGLEEQKDMPSYKRALYYSKCGRHNIRALAELVKFFRSRKAEFVTCRGICESYGRGRAP